MKRMLRAALLFLLLSGTAFAQSGNGRSLGQVLYLPIYSRIWHGATDRQGNPLKALVRGDACPRCFTKP